MSSQHIRIIEVAGEFAENKDKARYLRENFIKQAMNKGEGMILDFSGVDSTTQSFVHAMLSDVISTHKETALELLEFKGCNGAVRSLVTTVVNYSLE